uniref:IS66 family transposase n=1 Tax=Phocaeicola coprocola TaxID=310298 RepID=UPI003FEEAFB9
MGKFKKPVFTLWLTRLPNLSELKHRKARLIGESIYGLFFAKHVKLVYYHHYNNGSRASDVAKTFLERIHHKVVMMMQDTKLMANELMRKAVNYTINQWKSLKNILKDGSAEISNNLCEQRMKPVKLLLKNCMNIGSEDAAGNSAFIFSLIESCKLNDIAPQDYLKHLFECILHGKDCDKKVLLPCFYKSEC